MTIAMLTSVFQIAAVLEEAWAPEYTYIGIIVDMNAVQKLQVRTFFCDWGLVAHIALISWN